MKVFNSTSGDKPDQNCKTNEVCKRAYHCTSGNERPWGPSPCCGAYVKRMKSPEDRHREPTESSRTLSPQGVLGVTWTYLVFTLSGKKSAGLLYLSFILYFFIVLEIKSRASSIPGKGFFSILHSQSSP